MNIRKLLKNAVIDAFEPKTSHIQDVLTIGKSLNFWTNFNFELYNKLREKHGKTPLQQR